MSIKRKALLIGINEYVHVAPLKGCTGDATKMRNVLSRNDNGEINFDCELLIANRINGQPKITEAVLKEKIRELFAHEVEIALLYFSGHGFDDGLLGGSLATQEAQKNDAGVSFLEILMMAEKSKAEEIVIILDCCFAGDMGSTWKSEKLNIARLREGISILSASRSDQYAAENDRGGYFTNMVREALAGGASDILGRVTIASIYNYVDQIFGTWEQRPIFKSHISEMKSLVKCTPKIDLKVLHKLPTYFLPSKYEHRMNPSYEHSHSSSKDSNIQIFNDLKSLRNVGLVKPIGTPDLYYAALESKSCGLTPLGKFYWDLVNTKKI